MANLIQRLGLVTGLGLAGVVGTGCETKVNVKNHFKAPTPKLACADGSKTYVDQTEHIQTEYLLGIIPVHQQLLRTVEEEWSCSFYYSHVVGDEVVGLVSKRVIDPDGNRQELQIGEDVDPATGRIVNHWDHTSVINRNVKTQEPGGYFSLPGYGGVN